MYPKAQRYTDTHSDKHTGQTETETYAYTETQTHRHTNTQKHRHCVSVHSMSNTGVMDYDEACCMHLTPGVVNNFPKAMGV